MGEKYKPGENQLQLYGLFRKLEPLLPNDYAFQLLVGYALLESLFNFETKSGSEEEIRFGEVKAIHAGLEGAVRLCSAQDTTAPLDDLRAKMVPAVSRLFDQYDGNSKLLQGIVDVLGKRRKNYEDVLSRRIEHLMSQIEKRGPLNGTRNILDGDYAAIRNCFWEGFK